MTTQRIREYLYDLDGLRQEIADLRADISQYDAMIPEPVGQPDMTFYMTKPPSKAFSNTLIRPMGSPRTPGNVVERLVLLKISYIEKMYEQLKKLQNIQDSIQCIHTYLNKTDMENKNKLTLDVWNYKYFHCLNDSQIAYKTGLTEFDIGNIDKRKIVFPILENYLARK